MLWIPFRYWTISDDMHVWIPFLKFQMDLTVSSQVFAFVVLYKCFLCSTRFFVLGPSQVFPLIVYWCVVLHLNWPFDLVLLMYGIRTYDKYSLDTSVYIHSTLHLLPLTHWQILYSYRYIGSALTQPHLSCSIATRLRWALLTITGTHADISLVIVSTDYETGVLNQPRKIEITKKRI